MLARVLKTISRYNMLPSGVRVVVAVSGGADSVCLLYVLKELAPHAIAGIAHVNHHWRAEASDEDERFVAAMASSLSLPFFRADAAPTTGNREQEARRARQGFFSSLNEIVALGHTRDDQAETVLFRFLRGSGLTGLAGIPPITPKIIRPLIDITRPEIEEYLRSKDLPWREDASNADLKFARNRIRHQLLPQLVRDWNPQIVKALANMADLAYEEECFWQTVGQVPDLSSAELPATALTLPRAQARRQIRRAIQHAKGDLRRIDFDHVEAVFEVQKVLHLPGVTVTKSFDTLRFSPSTSTPVSPPAEIAPPGTYRSPDGLSEICIETSPNACATLKTEACWFQRCTPLVLRGWQPGDRYRPAGQSRDQKIQEMFQKARVPSWRRASWPILTSGDKILWSRQFGVAHECAVPFSGCSVLYIGEVI